MDIIRMRRGHAACACQLQKRRASSGRISRPLAPPVRARPLPVAPNGGASRGRACPRVDVDGSVGVRRRRQPPLFVGKHTTSPRGRTECSDCVRRFRTGHGHSAGLVREAVRNPVPDRGDMQGTVAHAGTNGRGRECNPVRHLNMDQ